MIPLSTPTPVGPPSHEIGLVEQPNKTLRSSLRLELSIAPLEKLLDLVPNGKD
jgi:hypothetical protein